MNAAPEHIVSWSEIDTARQCPHKHVLSYQERWRKDSSSPALNRGTSWHTMMEVWYDRTKPEDVRRQEIYEFCNQHRDPSFRGSEDDLLWWMFEGYADHYGDDSRNGWKIVAIELPFQVPLRYPAADGNGRRSRIHIKGKIDLIVLWNGRLWVVDHKTCARLPTDKELALDDQFGLYSWAMRQLGRPIFGSLHNAVRTKMPAPDSRPVDDQGRSLNKDGSVSKQQPAGSTPADRFKRTLMNRTDMELITVANEAFETMHTLYYKGQTERHPNSDTCKWRCDYTETCLAGRKGQDERRLMEDYGFRVDLTRH